ncbi:thiolase family protein [Microbacterium sp. PI-1]|uniref:thiolase C-terminal domain-containing protein n=1 Tax=Microbacterium sp. PI-1 TaxID=2545631 RepID=UPI00103F1131|nr:thiolase family protein [Microbacterium sp. PI-1]TCJ21957.1 thiolase family protein [Microbacterium sp. PI-1]
MPHTPNHRLSGNAAIVGVGRTSMGKLPGSTALGLGLEALNAALADAGIDKSEIDGILTHPGTTSREGANHYLRLSEAAGIDPRYAGSKSMGGATAGALVQEAVMAIDAGLATTVACVFGDAALTGGQRFNSPNGDPGLNWGIWGMFGPQANSALGARRHMTLYGTTSEQLGAVSVTFREHAQLNTDAVMYGKPITLEDHQSSRMVVEPFHLLDCCLISDGGVAIIVTSAERAKDLAKPAVHIAGMGQGYTARKSEQLDWWYLPHQRAVLDEAWAMSGLGPDDIDVAELYDNFTFSVLLWLEHGGFVAPGESGAFVAEGNLRLGSRLPTNTHGGSLSDAYMQGWTHIVEGVRQIRGEAGERQVAGAETCLTTGRGMALNTANALVLTK